MTHEVRIGADYMCTRRALTTGHRACLSSVRTRLKLSMADQSTPSERLPVGPATPQKDAPPDAETKKSKKKARGRLNDSPDTQLSKTLSYMLRHGAAKESLNIRADGFVKMDDLVRLTRQDKRNMRDQGALKDSENLADFVAFVPPRTAVGTTQIEGGDTRRCRTHRQRKC